MQAADINPFLRAAEIQPAVLEGHGARMAYDHRLFYILEGEGTLVLEGAPHPLAPDTLLLFPPEVGYHFVGRLRVAVLNFDLTRACAARKKPICPPPVSSFDPDLRFDTARLDPLSAPLVLTARGHLREDILSLVHAFRERSGTADAITSALLKKLLAGLLAPAGETREGETVHRVRRYLRLYAAEIKDNAEIAKAFGYHPVYLSTLFREQTGETLHHALLAERLRLSKSFLERTDHSVEEIALDTGFSSRSHFCTAFKADTGMTPREWRKAARTRGQRI